MYYILLLEGCTVLVSPIWKMNLMNTKGKKWSESFLSEDMNRKERKKKKLLSERAPESVGTGVF